MRMSRLIPAVLAGTAAAALVAGTASASVLPPTHITRSFGSVLPSAGTPACQYDVTGGVAAVQAYRDPSGRVQLYVHNTAYTKSVLIEGYAVNGFYSHTVSSTYTDANVRAWVDGILCETT